MHGYDVLWLPGTDHAGIATQNVVEKQLAAEGKSRHDLGRDAFEARVWEWVAESRGTITSQMRKLGSSVDWSRERFTLDENLSRAVRRVFVSLYEDDLIYRAKYLVSWCPAVPDRAVGPGGGACAGARRALSHPVPVRRWRRIGHRGDDAPGDDARRYRGGGAPGRRPLRRPRRPDADAAGHRARPPGDCRRLRRPGLRHRCGQGHPGARSQRLRHRRAPRARAGVRHRRGRPDDRGRRTVRGAGPVRGAHGARRAARGRGSARPDRGSRARRRAVRAVRDGGRAAAVDPVVRAHRAAGGTGARGRGRGRHPLRARQLDPYLQRLDDQHPRLVHLAPALVGAPHSGLVLRRVRQAPRRRDGARRLRLRRRAPPGDRRPRHLVQLRALAVQHPGVAGRDARTSRATTRRVCSSPPTTSSFSGSPA